MSTLISNNIVVINDEGDVLNVPQITISSITIHQTKLPPVSLTYLPTTTISITRKPTKTIIITSSF